ncbi:MAG: OmpA family protein [Cellvibrionaceae bacterium]
MSFKIQLSRAIVVTVLFSIAMLSIADDIRDSLFTQADDALRNANMARANVLAPRNYEKAANAYRKAEEGLKKGQSIEKIKSDLQKAITSFNAAAEATRLAEVTFTTSIQARNDAEAAQASKYAKESWAEAEKAFAEAARRLEGGNVNKAKKEAQEAETAYRTAELQAIKMNYLSETAKLIQTAKKNKVDRYAPVTLAKAEALVLQAEKELNENRYDTDRPRSLAKQAHYEAKHAVYIAGIAKPMVEEEQTPEQFILSAEEPVADIASALDMVAEFDAGMTVPTERIRTEIASLRKDSTELVERKSDIASLESEIQQMEMRLGVQSERLAAQEEARRRFNQLENMFNVDEAIVLSQKGDILIRTIGLNFDAGSSQISSDYFSLLKKVQSALALYPKSTVIVEGHTDSFGGDDANFDLSVARAESVRSYLMANMSNREASSVKAVGFGETKPIANNETQEGRQKNRRIDLILKATER